MFRAYRSPLYILWVSLIFLAVIGPSCDSMNVFEATDQAVLTPSTHIPDQDEILLVHLTGGLAGVSETLRVFSDGYATVEGHVLYAQRNTQLSATEMKQLKDTFAENGFFQLKSSYFDARVMDAFNYDIRYVDGKTAHTVQTNNFSVPENLSRIIEAVHGLFDRVVNDGLALELTVSKMELNPNESLEMTLKIINKSTKSMTLSFSDAQRFDFIVKIRTENSTDVAWNWAHDKVFAQVLGSIRLQPAEVVEFKETWNGSDNLGNRVKGFAYLSAKLPSTPGGTTREIEIVVH